MTTNNGTAVMTEEQLREGLAMKIAEVFGEMADAAIAYLRAHSPEAAEVERLKADNAQWADALVDADAEHDRLSTEISRLTRELADVSISRDEWQQLASDLKLLVEAHTDLQALEAKFGESHGQ